MARRPTPKQMELMEMLYRGQRIRHYIYTQPTLMPVNDETGIIHGKEGWKPIHHKTFRSLKRRRWIKISRREQCSTYQLLIYKLSSKGETEYLK